MVLGNFNISVSPRGRLYPPCMLFLAGDGSKVMIIQWPWLLKVLGGGSVSLLSFKDLVSWPSPGCFWMTCLQIRPKSIWQPQNGKNAWDGFLKSFVCVLNEWSKVWHKIGPGLFPTLLETSRIWYASKTILPWMTASSLMYSGVLWNNVACNRGWNQKTGPE